MTPLSSRHLWYARLVFRDIFYSLIVKVLLFYTQTHGDKQDLHTWWGGEGICVSLWLDKQGKERGQINRGEWLMVSQIVLSGGKKIYKDEKSSFKAFHFKGKWVGEDGYKASWIVTVLMMLLELKRASWFHSETGSIKPTEELCATTSLHDSAFPALLGCLIWLHGNSTKVIASASSSSFSLFH